MYDAPENRSSIIVSRILKLVLLNQWLQIHQQQCQQQCQQCRQQCHQQCHQQYQHL